jgi:hypothetical protein
MALSAGTASAAPGFRTGLAGALYDALAGEFDIPSRAEDSIQRMCNKMAEAIVQHIKDHADVIIGPTTYPGAVD